MRVQHHLVAAGPLGGIQAGIGVRQQLIGTGQGRGRASTASRSTISLASSPLMCWPSSANAWRVSSRALCRRGDSSRWGWICCSRRASVLPTW
ncbi:hypothetical protein G6F46_014846 [Rhizopus delemar]|nr:hypothetical protein G6F46_014846 [Rhizopus delemar]